MLVQETAWHRILGEMLIRDRNSQLVSVRKSIAISRPTMSNAARK